MGGSGVCGTARLLLPLMACTFLLLDLEARSCTVSASLHPGPLTIHAQLCNHVENPRCGVNFLLLRPFECTILHHILVCSVWNTPVSWKVTCPKPCYKRPAAAAGKQHGYDTPRDTPACFIPEQVPMPAHPSSNPPAAGSWPTCERRV